VRGLLVGLLFWSTAATAQVTIKDPWARATPPNAKLAAGYLTIANAGASDKLIAASSSMAKRVEMHITLRDGEILRMREVKELGIPQQSSLVLAPGGAHLMLIDIKRPFKAGEKVPVTLKFASGREVKIELAVRQATKPAAPAHQHKH
jgi:periplasmic copper chaperone A